MKLFKDFWAVDWNRKRDFVISNITVTAIARKTTGDKSRRKLTVKYCLPTQQSHIKVCKEYFLSTPSIGAMFVRWTLNKSSSSSLNSNYTRRMQYYKIADIRTLCSKGKNILRYQVEHSNSGKKVSIRFDSRCRIDFLIRFDSPV